MFTKTNPGYRATRFRGSHTSFAMGLVQSVLRLGLAAFFLTAGSFAQAADASSFPVQSIRLLVGYSPGGSVDIVARSYAQRLSSLLGQNVVVENKAGASGVIAGQVVASAQPNGYTLYFVASPTVTITPAMQKTPFDPLKDFRTVGSVVNYTNVLLVSSDLPYKTVAQIVDAARAKPGEITFASSGVGSSNHLSGELLADKANVKLTHVPFKGNAPAMLDLMAGRITMLFDLNTTAAAQVKGGRVRALAVTSAKRNAMFPDVPTMMESGFKDFEFTGWLGILAPADTPQGVISTLAAANESILKDADFRAEMTASGYEIAPATPAELTERLKREGKVFENLVQRANLRSN